MDNTMGFKILKIVKKYGGVLTDDRHFVDEIKTLLERSDNSGYATPPKLPSFKSVFDEVLSMEGYSVMPIEKTYEAIKKLGNFA